jgi:acyl carrier protein
MENKIMQILEELRPDFDFESSILLIDGGVLDSFDIVMLVGELNDAFGVNIGAAELQAENFNSPSAIQTLIERLKHN